MTIRSGAVIAPNLSVVYVNMQRLDGAALKQAPPQRYGNQMIVKITNDHKIGLKSLFYAYFRA